MKKTFKLLVLVAFIFCLTGCGSKSGVYVTAADDTLNLSKDGSCTYGDVTECNWHEQSDGNIIIKYVISSKTNEKTCIPHKGNLLCGNNYYEKK